ncbi:hypothetical protein BAE44_0009431 [Dichanthelium oligosanthes]|uniref:Bifunctional inhibitor/plant lipid transfer protein/seed storage helical domain-containing protein n=1 Tax=Dichanthelium oligosanthes TaxID=888268 RepID=A0A1E5VWQ1_9POAL|nr:hypothetical protein BAE44_0009431 [Dichanthelium oligosanthes]
MALTARAAAVSCLLLALAASAAGAGSHSHSHSPAPAPAVDCFAVATSLIDCMGYVSPGNTAKSPSKACCGEVKAAVASPVAVDCLCSLAGNKNLGIPIDMSRVLALPGACGASNSVFNKCHLAGSPAEGNSSPFLFRYHDTPLLDIMDDALEQLTHSTRFRSMNFLS